jgi:hypothetical protein
MKMTVRVIPTSAQHTGDVSFLNGTGNKWKVVFQIDGGELHTTIAVPIIGSSSADLAMSDALNKLKEFLHEAEQDVISQQAINGKH